MGGSKVSTSVTKIDANMSRQFTEAKLEHLKIKPLN